MTTFQIDITPFQDNHQADVDLLITTIADEFKDNIFSSRVKANKEVKRLPLDKYWVACTNGRVVGTIYITLPFNSISQAKKTYKALVHLQSLVGVKTNLFDDK